MAMSISCRFINCRIVPKHEQIYRRSTTYWFRRGVLNGISYADQSHPHFDKTRDYLGGQYADWAGRDHHLFLSAGSSLVQEGPGGPEAG